MILLALRVRGFGPFRKETELAGFGEAVNVLAAPNESGKTTMMQALHHALFSPYRTQGNEIQEFVPWGTDLSPSIEVEFLSGGNRYRLKKRFVTDPQCSLEQWTGADYEPVADGDRADERARQVLLGDRPGKGAASVQNRGLARLLWMPQGRDAFEPPQVEGSAADHLRQLMGGLTLDSKEATLHTRITSMRNAVFTATGRIRSQSELRQIIEEVERLEDRFQEVQTVYGETQRITARLNETRTKLRQLADERETVRDRLEALAEQIRGIRELRAAIKVAQAEWETRSERLKRVQRDQATLGVLRNELMQYDAKLQSAKIETEALAASIGQLEAERDGLMDRVSTARTALDKQLQRHEWWNLLREAASRQESGAQLQRRLEQAQGWQQELEDHRKIRDEFLRPGDGEVAEAREWSNRLRELDAEMKIVGMSLSFRFDEARTATVHQGDDTARHKVAAGEERTVHGQDELRLEIEGVGVIRARTGAAEPQQLREERDQLSRRFEGLLHKYGAKDVAELEKLAERGKALAQEIVVTESKLQALLGDIPSVAELEKAASASRRELVGLCREANVTPQSLAEVEVPSKIQADRGLARARAELREAEQALERLQSALRRSAERGEEVWREHTRLQAKRESTSETVHGILETYGGTEGLTETLQRFGSECAQSESELTRLQGKLPPEGADPEQQEERHLRALEQLEAEIEGANADRIRFEAKIAEAGESGLYGALAEAEEELAEAKRRRTDLWRRAEAARLLSLLIDERRHRMAENLLRPVESEVTRLLARVSGNEDRQILVDESMAVRGIRTVGADRSWRQLSIGTQEQLLLLTRLALARRLAQDERMLVIVDDNLVNTDGPRHERLIEILEEASANLQILLLTCHPQHYRLLDATQLQLT